MAGKELKSEKKRTLFSRLKKVVLLILMVTMLSGSVMTIEPRNAEAFGGFFCFCIGIACDIPDVIISSIFFFLWEAIWNPIIQDNIEDHINSEENWIVEDFFADYWIRGLSELVEFLSATGMHQMQVLGSLLDAKTQLETQRLFWVLHAQAHKDYHPSDGFCWFGTNVRSLASTEMTMSYNKKFLSKKLLNRSLGSVNQTGAEGEIQDKEARWRKFVKTYCNPKDNYWSQGRTAEVKGTGMDLACDHDGDDVGVLSGAQDMKRVNRDVDYTQLIDFPRTLDVDFKDDSELTARPDEEDVIALASNLYGNKLFSRKFLNLGKNESAQNLYLTLRSIVAKRNVAENTFNSVVALKSAGTVSSATTAPPQQVKQFMASIIKDLMPAATTPEQIYEFIGENPSYYAQMEVLAKRIYQNSDFYADLYDTPANVKRKSVAMKAIELMLDRELYESELRQEMVMSVLLSSELRDRFRKVNKELQTGKQ